MAHWTTESADVSGSLCVNGWFVTIFKTGHLGDPWAQVRARVEIRMGLGDLGKLTMTGVFLFALLIQKHQPIL